MLDDGQLLRQYVENPSGDAFAELVRRHLKLVYFAALRRLDGDSHAASDVSQGVFILLARKAGKLSHHPTLAGWLYSTVNFEVSALLRSNRRRQAREQQAAADLALGGDEQAVDLAVFRPVLDHALMKLGAADREAVLLRFLEDCPFSEVAHRLGVTEGAAQRRVSRAVEKLRKVLADQGVKSGAGALALALGNESSLAAPTTLAASICHAALGAFGTGTTGASGAGTLARASPFGSAVTMLSTFAALAGLTAAALGISRFAESRRLEFEQRKLQSASQLQQDQLRASERDAAQQEKRLTELRRTLSASRALLVHRQADPRQDARQFFAAYPEAKDMVLRLGRAQIASAYDPFFKSTGMTPEEIARFEEVTLQTWLDSMTLTPALITPDTCAPPLDEVRRILGAERARQFQDFLPLAPAYTFVKGIAVYAGIAGQALTADQQDELVRILIAHRPGARSSDPVNIQGVDWEAAMPEAQQAVSHEQWKVVRSGFLGLRFQQAAMSVLTRPKGIEASKTP